MLTYRKTLAMSLYDRVFYPGKCPTCSRRITEFQTKDTGDPAIIGVKLSRVKTFYTICYCGTYFTYAKSSRGEFEYGIIETPITLRTHSGHARPAEPDN